MTFKTGALLAVALCDIAMTSVLDDTWGSVVVTRVLFVVQICLHSAFMLLAISGISGSEKSKSQFYRFSWLWLVRLCIIFIARSPRILTDDLRTFWDNGLLHFLVVLHSLGSAFFYAAAMRILN
jgi:hypothetical protein